MQDFDVVVIGSGLGGLSAAAHLGGRGLKVLVLERHSVPGGYASSFIRGRFEFDVSLHQLSGLGSAEMPGPLYMLLDGCGVLPKMKFLKIPECYRVVYPGLDITIPVGRDNFERTLKEYFPAEAQNIERFSALVFNLFTEVMTADVLRKGMGSVNPETSPILSKHLFSSMAEAVYPILTDEKLRCVVGQLSNYVAQPPSRVAFMTYAMALTSYILLGPCHIRGTSQALSQAFVDVIEEKGGQVWFNNGAARIKTKDGRVMGVTAEDGTEIATSRVVSNANPFETLVNLVGVDNTPDWYLRRLSSWSPGIGTLNVWMGLDRPPEYFGFKVHETFVGLDYDMDRMYETARTLTYNPDPPGAAVTAYNLADPEFSPPGTTSIVVTMGAYGEPWQKLSPAEYLRDKNRQADQAVEMAERVAPGVRNHIEVLETATPLTNRRYTLNPGGSFSGFSENRQPGKGMQIPSRTPIEGLYMSGAWVNIGGGYMPTMMSGLMAAGDLMEDRESGSFDISALKAAMIEQTPEGQGIARDLAERPSTSAGRPFAGRLRLKVEEIIRETASASTLRMVPVDGAAPPFRAGQYLTLFVNVNGVATSRPYSIASAPGRPWLDITVRRKPGGFVSPYLLDEVKTGDVFEASGPHGTFFQDPVFDAADSVLLAGGAGITPMASMIRQAVAEDREGSIQLLYGSRDPEDIIFREELEEIARQNDQIRVDFIISEPPDGYEGVCGLLDTEMIISLVGPVENKTFYLCGPSQMHLLCIDALKALGVPERRIKREAYGPPDKVSEYPTWPGLDPETEFDLVEERSGRKIKVKAGEPLLNSLEREGLVVPAVCRSGECTACRTRLVDGKVFVPDNVARRWIDERAGFIHPCMSYPIDHLRIRL